MILSPRNCSISFIAVEIGADFLGEGDLGWMEHGVGNERIELVEMLIFVDGAEDVAFGHDEEHGVETGCEFFDFPKGEQAHVVHEAEDEFAAFETEA